MCLLLNTMLIRSSRKTLLPVILHYPAGASKPSCPSCTKELSNSTSPVLLSSRTPAEAAERSDDGPKKKKSKKDKDEPFVCGHVICNTCSDRMMKSGKRCPVCEAVVGKEGMIPLGKEGEPNRFSGHLFVLLMPGARYRFRSCWRSRSQEGRCRFPGLRVALSPVGRCRVVSVRVMVEEHARS